jgi:hypothetical protein
MSDKDFQGGSSIPPRASFTALREFIGSLKGAIPRKLDRSMMRKMSGSGQTEALAALQFLGLISADGTVSEDFRALVESHGTAQWSATLKPILDRAFTAILAIVDVKTGTQKQLRDALIAGGTGEGETLDKAQRFFITAMKDAGVAVSPWFVARRPRGTGKRASAARGEASATPKGGDPNEVEDEDEAEQEEEEAAASRKPKRPVGMRVWPLSDDHEMWLPSKLTEADIEMIEEYHPILRRHAGLKPKAGP